MSRGKGWLVTIGLLLLNALSCGPPSPQPPRDLGAVVSPPDLADGICRLVCEMGCCAPPDGE